MVLLFGEEIAVAVTGDDDSIFNVEGCRATSFEHFPAGEILAIENGLKGISIGQRFDAGVADGVRFAPVLPTEISRAKTMFQFGVIIDVEILH